MVVAERVLRDVDSLGAGLRDLAGLRRGRIALAITPTLAEILLPAAIRAPSTPCTPTSAWSLTIARPTSLSAG
jgi:hypothetical protein